MDSVILPFGPKYGMWIQFIWKAGDISVIEVLPLTDEYVKVCAWNGKFIFRKSNIRV